MKKRSLILEFLNEYRGIDENEEKTRLKMIEFVKFNPRCFDRELEKGHITGSALVVDRGVKYTLLTHHRKIGKWFQFGGHSDGHYNPLEVAWREAEEESGLESLEYLPNHTGIFDLDIHSIPEFNGISVHYHYDVRILLTADKEEPYKISSESKDLKWVELDKISKYNSDDAFLRMAEKARAIKKS